MSLHMPGEFEPHARTLLCWPARRDMYGSFFSEAEDAHALVANTIAQFEPVVMVTDPVHVERAEMLCGPNVQIVSLRIDDSWCRDSGPIYAQAPDGAIVALDFVFNSWGKKMLPYDNDAALVQTLTEKFGEESRQVPMVLEGGSISVDGQGNLVTTMQCLLNPNRNPTMTMTEIENTLMHELGVASIIWLPHGLSLDHDTDGHVDNVAAFTKPGHLLLQGCTDTQEADFERLAINEKVARSSFTAHGDKVGVDVIPVLPFIDTPVGRRTVPYLNYYVGNKYVVIPVCGHAADTDMVQMISSFYPGRVAVPLDVGRILAIGGGGIHCITQQVPLPETN